MVKSLQEPARIAGWLLAGVVVLALAGCRQPDPPRPGPPPLKVVYRKSKIPAQGMVAGINNPSPDESIRVVAVFVRGKAEEGERSYRLDRPIRPLDSITVGWVELDGWKLKPGDTLRIRCQEYTEELVSVVPE